MLTKKTDLLRHPDWLASPRRQPLILAGQRSEARNLRSLLKAAAGNVDGIDIFQGGSE